MIDLHQWMDTITIFEILNSAPHGFFTGCGGTSEYLAYIFRNKLATIDDLFEIRRKNEYYDSAINEKYFASTQIEECLEEISQRLTKNEYVRISFDFDVERCSKIYNMLDIIKNPPKPCLFDHDFVITNNSLRFDSYINQNEPRCTYWENYQNDLRELFINLSFQSSIQKWEDIFGVKCDDHCKLSNMQIIISD